MVQTHVIPTEQEIREAICRDCFYGQQPKAIVVPSGYTGATTIYGIPVEVVRDAIRPYIVPVEGGRLGFDGREIY
jgi:hypothetical protein